MGVPNPRKVTCEDVKNYWVNDGPKAIFIALYLLANAAVFMERFTYYYWGNGHDIFELLGHGVTMARGAAAALKLNGALVLIPVCRNFLSWLRGTWVNTYIPIDKNIIFHRKIAWAIAFWSTVHCMAHMFNFNRISQLTDKDDLKMLELTEAPPVSALMFSRLPGATGHIILLCMVFMYSSAIESIRRPFFEAFWYTHHLFLVFFGLLCFHGASAILEPPTFWLWWIGPGIAYGLERTLRVLRGSQDTILQLVVQHPSKVIELQMRKATFVYKPGQYLFLNCPYIAPHEWHPFTITSAPEESFVSVHIRIVGDWTGKLAKLLNPQNKLGVVQENVLTAPNGLPILRVDGPFGAASEEVFDYETVMLVGAGIGVTPFASILKSIRYKIERQIQSGTVTIPIKKVYFYWICRDKNSFEWFSELLAVLERENINNFLEIHTYLTAAMSPEDVRNIMYGEEDGTKDVVTGLQSPTHYGRPNFKEIFEEKTRQHPNTTVGVFFCGPRVISKLLYRNSRRYTSTKSGGTRFKYNKENF